MIKKSMKNKPEDVPATFENKSSELPVTYTSKSNLFKTI